MWVQDKCSLFPQIQDSTHYLGHECQIHDIICTFFEKNVHHCYSLLPEGLKTCQLTDQFHGTSKDR